MPIPEADCRDMVNEIKRDSKKYKELRKGGYVLKTDDHFKCLWNDIEVVDYIHQSARKYKGAVRGANQMIHNKITITSCLHNRKTCVEKEDGSRIIWELTNHNFEKFKTIGEYLVHRVEDLYMIPDLVLGGTSQIVTKDHQYIQLENGYIIEKKGQDVNQTRN